jgi:hypothetical protein
MSHAGYLILAEHLAQQIATDYDKHGTEKQLAASIKGAPRERGTAAAPTGSQMMKPSPHAWITDMEPLREGMSEGALSRTMDPRQAAGQQGLLAQIYKRGHGGSGY